MVILRRGSSMFESYISEVSMKKETIESFFLSKKMCHQKCRKTILAGGKFAFPKKSRKSIQLTKRFRIQISIDQNYR